MIVRILSHDDGLVHVAWCRSMTWNKWTTACACGTGFKRGLANLELRDIQVVVVGPPTCLFCVARPRLFKARYQ